MPSIILQSRDLHLLREVGLMRVIDRQQAMCVGSFGSVTRANARLLALTRAGFLRRFFLGTVGGARKALYSVSAKGGLLVGVPARGPRRGRDQTLGADFFVAHQLWINEVYCAVKFQSVPPGVRFVRWLGFHEPLASGSALIPDGYAEFATPERSVATFLEVDLGHESRRVWQEKVQQYLRYAASGEFAKRFGGPQFRVLTVANSDARVVSLRAATSALTEKIFWFTTMEAVRRDGFWAHIWFRATGNTHVPLL